MENKLSISFFLILIELVRQTIVHLLSLKSIVEIKKENLNNKICKYMNLTITSYKQKLVAEKSQENAKENTCSDAPAGIV